MKAKIWKMLVLVQVALLLSNCCGSDSPPPYIRITETQLKNIVTVDGQVPSSKYWSGDTVARPSDLYGIGMTFTTAFVSDASKSSWGNNAYADVFWSCGGGEPGRNGAREYFTELKITSTSTFDNQHPPGTLLNDLFYIRDNRYLDPLEVPLDSIIGSTRFAARYFSHPESIAFLLQDRPTIDSVFAFKVELLLSDGRIFEQISPQIIFRP